MATMPAIVKNTGVALTPLCRTAFDGRLGS